jgi:transcriptional antiterminator
MGALRASGTARAAVASSDRAANEAASALPSAIPLDSRQERIARALLNAVGPVAAEALAADLHLTDRVVRYNLTSVEAFFAANGLAVLRRPGVGVWADGPASARASVLAALDAAGGPAVIDPGDRQARILVTLLLAAPEPLSSETFETRLGVSRATVRRDVRGVEAWLEQHRLHLRRLPGVGIGVVGSELDVRGGLLGAVLEFAPPRLLVRSHPPLGEGPVTEGSAPADVERLVGELDLPVMRRVLRSVYPDLGDDDPPTVSASVYLGILTLRVRAGKLTRMSSGRLRSLQDHPASIDATRIATALGAATGVTLGRPDIAAITESLLGLQIVDQVAEPGEVDDATIDRILVAAAARLHPLLVEDAQLRASLTEHLRRLHARLRFGLPVSNPLQQEVRRRYPDVYRVAGDVLAEIEPVRGAAMPSDEVGLLTMYLAGSLERLRLRPKIRVTVVCPAGMATAWILVSRLLAEFPQLEVARVVSKAAVGGRESEPGDLIVSTIPLDEEVPGTPAVVVNPLLREADIRRLGRAIALLSD